VKTGPWRKILYGIGALAVVALVVLVLLPDAIPVDVAAVERGPMRVTVDDQGETRSHDRFVVVAPVAGRMSRIALHDGDAVAEGQVIVQIAPLPMSAREREEQIARVASAEATQREAEERLRHAEEDLAQAKRERQRVEKLLSSGVVSEQAAEQARNLEVTSANEAEAARFRARSAAAEVKVARSGLLGAQAQSGPGALVRIRAPVAGRILRIPDPSERVVAAGTTLLTLGDLRKLEVVIELLSSEAVKVQPGMPVLLEGWGGSEPIRAQVRVVEPYAVTKVSALGIEEKRVNIIADFVDPPGPLGDGFRVTARIITWSEDSVLKVPTSALFRCGEEWCVFSIEGQRAMSRTVEIGHRNALEAEVVQGLDEGELVIRHPGNQIEEASRVTPR
jgi:HlyD family secretion protein